MNVFNLLDDAGARINELCNEKAKLETELKRTSQQIELYRLFMQTISDLRNKGKLPLYVDRTVREGNNYFMYAYKDYIGDFIDLFNRDEYIETVINDGENDNRQLMFLIEPDPLIVPNEVILMLNMEDAYYEDNSIISLSILLKPISECRGYIYDDVVNGLPTKSFSFRDNDGTLITNSYKVNKELEKYDGIDIKDILKPLVFFDMLERLTYGDTSKKEKTRAREK